MQINFHCELVEVIIGLIKREGESEEDGLSTQEKRNNKGHYVLSPLIHTCLLMGSVDYQVPKRDKKGREMDFQHERKGTLGVITYGVPP